MLDHIKMLTDNREIIKRLAEHPDFEKKYYRGRTAKYECLKIHKKYKGKVEMISRVPLNTREDMSTYYSPGVAQPCLEIEKNPELAYDYTWKGRTIAVVSDGSAVLGLGNI